MTKLLASLTVMSLALVSKPALADVEERINGSFNAVYATGLNSANKAYCGGQVLSFLAQAYGAGYTTRGGFSFELHKTLNFPGAMQGCVTLTAANGDILYANYMGTTDGATATGTLTFTGGTGRYKGAGGAAKFTAVFVNTYPSLTIFGQPQPPPLPPCSDTKTIDCLQTTVQGTAFYVIEGTVTIP